MIATTHPLPLSDVLFGAGDWGVFLSSVLAFLHGENPYLIGEGFRKVYEPFWTYILLSPFALLPLWPGRILLFVVSLLAFAVTAVKMGAKPWQVVLFLTSASVMGDVYDGNINWLVTLGLWMPAPIGLFFVMMKPQIGIGIAIYWFYASWKEGGARQVFTTFAPITIAYLLSFWIYGFWIKSLIGMPANPANISAFPYSILFGLLVLFFSIRDRNQNLSALSGPLFAPYVTRQNYAVSLLSLFQYPYLFIAAWIILWIPFLIDAHLLLR